jgi:hypothetical protein
LKENTKLGCAYKVKRTTFDFPGIPAVFLQKIRKAKRLGFPGEEKRYSYSIEYNWKHDTGVQIIFSAAKRYLYSTHNYNLYSARAAGILARQTGR